MGAHRLNAVSRVFATTPTRRGLLTLLGGLSVAVIPKRGVAMNKKRNACTNGPCTYDQCLSYLYEGAVSLDQRGYDDIVIAAYVDVGTTTCCAGYALDYSGNQYRPKVVSCIQGLGFA